MEKEESYFGKTDTRRHLGEKGDLTTKMKKEEEESRKGEGKQEDEEKEESKKGE